LAVGCSGGSAGGANVFVGRDSGWDGDPALCEGVGVAVAEENVRTAGERIGNARLRGESGGDGESGVAQGGTGNRERASAVVCGRAGSRCWISCRISGWGTSCGRDHGGSGAAAGGDGLAGSESGEVAGLLHGSEGEVAVVFLSGDDASVDLVGAGGGGFE